MSLIYNAHPGSQSFQSAYSRLIVYYGETDMAPHYSTLSWKIPSTEDPGALQSMGLQRVGHNWVGSLSWIGAGNGNPLQYSCLENPRDRGMGEPDGLLSRGSYRVRHNWTTELTDWVTCGYWAFEMWPVQLKNLFQNLINWNLNSHIWLVYWTLQI